MDYVKTKELVGIPVPAHLRTCKDFMKLETPEEIIAKGDGAVSLVWENTLSVAHDCKSQLDNLVDYIDTQNKKIEESNRE